MSDITLSDITISYNVSNINSNFDIIQDSINNDILHLKGGNNILSQDLDVNGNKLLNIGVLDVNGLTINGQPVTITNLGALGPNSVGTSQIINGSVTVNKLGNDITSANFNFLQAGTGAISRTVQSKLRDTVSIKDFGAVCDGVTDDTAAINLALASGASRIRFVGTPLVSNTLYYRSDTILEFDKNASIIPAPIGSWTQLTLNSIPWGYAVFMNQNWQAATITDKNITFINARSTPASPWHGHFIGSRMIQNFQMVESFCTNYDDVLSSMACIDVIVRDSWCYNIRNCAYDFWEGPQRITVKNNTTIQANAGVNFNAVDTFNNNGFVADTLLVQGNRFYSSASSAVFVAPLGNTSYCTNVKILDNFIDQANTATGTGGGGAVWGGITVLRTSVTDIRGNTLNRIGSGSAPIIVSLDAGGYSQQTLVTDNSINNSNLGSTGFYIQVYGSDGKVWNNRAVNSTATGGVGIAVNDPTTVVGPNQMTGATTYLVNQNPSGGATTPALQLDQNTSGSKWESPQPIKAFSFQHNVSYPVSAAGTTAGTATVLVKPFNFVNVGAANSGVILPASTNNRVGEEWIIWNNTGNTIIVYPATGDTINGGASTSVANGSKARLISVAAQLWMLS